MTTSGVTENAPVRDVIIHGALRMVGAYAAPSSPRADDVLDANIALNMMLASWQIQNFIWLKEFITVPLVAGQRVYDLPDGVNSTYRPTRIFEANRVMVSGNEVPLESLSRSDYWALPNKTTPGVPNQYYYDPQLATGKLYVWPVPSTSTDSLLIDADRPLQMMIDSADTFDFPREWMEPIKYGLAVRIAPEYAVPLNERLVLERDFTSMAEKLLAYNMDYTSTFIGADTHG